MERGRRRLVVLVALLAHSACSNIISSVVGHILPPETIDNFFDRCILPVMGATDGISVH